MATVGDKALGLFVAVVLAWPMLGACNMVTGAGDLVLVSDDDDGTSAPGSGGDVALGGSGSVDTNDGTGGQVSQNGGSGGTPSSGVGAGGAGAGPTGCDYPAGPYSVAQGGTLPPTLSWQGIAPGSSTPTTVSVQDFFDCDGSKGIDALIFDTSQFG